MPQWLNQSRSVMDRAASSGRRWRERLAKSFMARGRAHRALAWHSSVEIWLDGERGCALGASGTGGQAIPLASSGDVAAALAVLEALAPKPAKPGLHRLGVIVGAPFVCYFPLAWRPLPTPAEWIAQARMQFARGGFGNPAGWRFVVPDAAWGQSRLAAAMPEALCAGIERLCSARKLRVAAIEPGYVRACTDCAARIEDGRIAVVELEDIDADGAIAHCGFRAQGQWTAFVTLPVAGDIGEAMRDATMLCAVPEPERTYVIGSVRAEGRDRRGRPGRREDVAVAGAAGLTQWLPAPWDIPL
ncbi:MULTISPECIES: hypothetical protein [Cupriavidus]|uniref:Uncharacterized protein n=1 Tax=Cupriavidus pauculus TaxID=82633 RepID=A0A5P2HE03_9BURK|nr:hypothetical protein [Cupriavidus pauculus]QET06242.1 hypothetical protein FOB72_30495 [Cupriavidus pauculus]